jgi:hypothetical protein
MGWILDLVPAGDRHQIGAVREIGLVGSIERSR